MSVRVATPEALVCAVTGLPELGVAVTVLPEMFPVADPTVTVRDGLDRTVNDLV